MTKSEYNNEELNKKFIEGIKQASAEGTTAAIVLFLRRHGLAILEDKAKNMELVTKILDYKSNSVNSGTDVIGAAERAIKVDIVQIRQIFEFGAPKDFSGFVRIVTATGVIATLEEMKPKIEEWSKEIKNQQQGGA